MYVINVLHMKYCALALLQRDAAKEGGSATPRYPGGAPPYITLYLLLLLLCSSIIYIYIYYLFIYICIVVFRLQVDCEHACRLPELQLQLAKIANVAAR